MTNCTKCGQPFQPVTQPTGRFDSWRGEPTQDEWRVCPNWRPRLFFGNGHDWQYLGENNIDGRDMFGRDPGKYQNPPGPPR